MDPIIPILETYLFLIPLVVLILSEFTKVTLKTFREGGNLLNGEWIKWLFQPGGIPSTHSAFVTSLLIIVGRKEDTTSIAFAIAFVLASIVWYDAVSIRNQLGKQAEVLNRLQRWKHLKEHLGHSFFEVIAGIAFGSVITTIGILLS